MKKTPKMHGVEKKFGVDIGEFLYMEYVENKRSITDISEEIQVNPATVSRWFSIFNVPVRDTREAAKARYEYTTETYRKELTKNARKRIDEIIENGDFWLKGKFGDENNAKKPEARRKISEFKKKNNPMRIEEHAMKMRKSMEQILRDRATIQELKFKEKIETKGYFPKFQHAEYKAVIDFAFIDLKIGIEIDGDVHLTNQAVKEKDRIRDEGLRERGWHILRFSNERIDSDIDAVIEEVIEIVRESGSKEAQIC